ncbi:MAG TPA: SPOR domain-containing protein [Pyrinomonadaceae bacterium]|nr:SPOR domain-containing protein [Pyrinomonadaceae bacterium]
MATETHKYPDQLDGEGRHSALKEFSRDERRPAVLLLSALVLSALFFGIGLMVGRWTAEPGPRPQAAPPGNASTASVPAQQPAASPSATNTAGGTSTAAERRFTLLVATYDSAEKAQPLIKSLREAGYGDARTTSPRAGEPRPRYSVLAGRFTQDEAREAARRMRSSNDPRLKNARVIEEQ